nr:uncharacterized protein LOC114917782 isoform X2 [Labrus bergylta]
MNVALAVTKVAHRCFRSTCFGLRRRGALKVVNKVSFEKNKERGISTITKIALRDTRPVQLQSCQCTCVAGAALCNHVAALLYQTAHYSQLNITTVPPVHSCTETEQQWHKPRTMGVKPGPVNEMVILSARPKERRLAQGVSSIQPSAETGCRTLSLHFGGYDSFDVAGGTF